MATSNEDERRHAIDELRRQINALEEDMRAGLADVPPVLDTADRDSSSARAAVLAANPGLARRIEEVRKQIDWLTKEVPATERDALAVAQSRADSVAAMVGDRAPVPHHGESPLAYRRRAVETLQRYSDNFSKVKLSGVPNDMFEAIEAKVYADAQAVGSSGQASPGQLFPVVEQDAAGRKITRYYGDIMTWMAPHMTDGAVCRIIRPEYE